MSRDSQLQGVTWALSGSSSAALGAQWGSMRWQSPPQTNSEDLGARLGLFKRTREDDRELALAASQQARALQKGPLWAAAVGEVCEAGELCGLLGTRGPGLEGSQLPVFCGKHLCTGAETISEAGGTRGGGRSQESSGERTDLLAEQVGQVHGPLPTGPGGWAWTPLRPGPASPDKVSSSQASHSANSVLQCFGKV